MLTREDGTIVTIDNLTDEDVALSDWNILEHLDSEEEIVGYLEGVAADIEEGVCEPAFFPVALADAAKARLINQLVRNAGIDRQFLCDMFLDTLDKPDAPEINRDVVVKVVEAFAVPVPV